MHARVVLVSFIVNLSIKVVNSYESVEISDFKHIRA
jgi:hypothetical protein